MRLRFRLPDDFHVHLRGGRTLQTVADYTARCFGRALVMPNYPAVCTAEELIRYRDEINLVVRGRSATRPFQPLMTLKLTPQTTPEVIKAARAAGAIAGKLYPDNVTSGSHGGVNIADLDNMGPVFDTMQDQNMVLCWHGENPGLGIFYLDAEKQMLQHIDLIVQNFPKLGQVLEHITTRESVAYVTSSPDRVAATITVHHLYLTGDDLVGRGEHCGDKGRSKLHPHHFCWPPLQRPEDRGALRDAAISGSPKFFLGTDSAPWKIVDKLGYATGMVPGCGCAGIFSSPVALPALLNLFCELDAVKRFGPFTSEFGARFYGLELNEGSIELQQRQWLVPDTIGGEFEPFLAGTALPWMVVED